MKKIKRQKTLYEIRQYPDQSSMKGDPLEGLSYLFDFIAVIFGLGIITLVVELIMYLIN